MVTQFHSPDRETVAAVGRALSEVPRAAFSVPHVYPSAAPDYRDAPRADRPPLVGDELRLYVHVPFCRYHCTFCHYAVRIGATTDTMARYVAALEREVEWVRPGTPLSQLFVGGGTPTALPPALLDRMLEAVFSRVRRVEGTVHTLEASPETISPAHIEVLRRHDIGRVSMGIQSLESGVLDTVRREQTGNQALESVDMLIDSGLILNVDMIYGLPGQTEQSFLADLQILADRGVPSLTLYSLRTNERTPVVRDLRDEDRFDLARIMRWRAVVKHAAESLGYTQVRWHTFKRLDSVARRHTRLPCFDDRMSGYQLGIGMSARSHLGHTIFRNHDQMNAYLDRVEGGLSPVEQIFEMAEEDRMTQFIARTLGDGQSLPASSYARTFGRPIEDDFGALLERLRAAGLIEVDGEVLELSELGELVYDLVTLAFYPRRAREWLAARGGWLDPEGARIGAI